MKPKMSTAEPFVVPEIVLSRDMKLTGTCTGGTRRCPLDGCTGLRVGVRWPDGKLTWPCTKGMRKLSPEKWKIE